MDYPSSKLTKPMRRAILIVFVALFFIISPIMILYTSGYRYDWKYGLLKETGAINIDVEPQNAIVYVNSVKFTTKMPLRLNDRIPNKYTVLITAPGYYDWKTDIEVKSKQTVYIKDIFLMKKNEPALLAEGDLNNFNLSYDGRYLAYSVRQNKKTEIWLKDLSGSQPDKILLGWPSEKNIQMVWGAANYFLTVSEVAPPYNFVYLIDAENPTGQFDLVKKIKYPIEKYQWKESGEPELFFSTKLKIMSILPRLNRQFTLGNNRYLDWYMENGKLWTLQTASGANQIQIIRDTLGAQDNFLADNANFTAEQKINFTTAEPDRIILKKAGLPEMIILTGNNKTYNVAGDKFLASRYNNWWLIWTPWEIWTHSNGEEPNLLNRSGEQLKKIIPLDKYNTLALVWSDKTTILFPYYLVNHDLLNYKIQDAAADTDKKIFYFIAEINNKKGLWQLNY